MGTGPPLLCMGEFGDSSLIASSTGFDAQAPATNLQTMQPSDRAQSTGIDGGVQFTLDRNTSEILNWRANLLSLLHSNCTEEASIRIRGAHSIAELDSDPGLDTSAAFAARGFGSHLRFQGDSQSASANSASWSSIPSYSFECRIRPEEIREQGILQFSEAAGGAVVLSMDSQGRILWRVVPTLLGNLVSQSVIAVGQDVHISGTYDQPTKTMELFIDGVLEGSQVVSQDPVAVAEFVFVGIGTGSAERFRGRIDDVRFWDFARTASQIQADYNGPLAGTESGLVAYWPLDEKGGTTATDLVSGVTLTLSGTPLPLWSFPVRFRASSNPVSAFAGDTRTHSLWFTPLGQAYRYWRVEVLDPQNADGFLAFGRLMMGWAHQFTRGMRYGSTPLGFRDSSGRRRLPGGPTLVRRRKARPLMRVDLRSTSEDELKRDIYAFWQARADARDILFVGEPYSDAYRHQSMMHCLFPEELQMNVPNFSTFDHSYVLEGLV